RVDHGKLYVFTSRRAGEKIERLKNETDSPASHAGEFPVGVARDIFSGQPVRAGIRDVEAAQDVQQRGFAGAGRAPDGDEAVFPNGKGNLAQGMDRRASIPRIRF